MRALPYYMTSKYRPKSVDEMNFLVEGLNKISTSKLEPAKTASTNQFTINYFMRYLSGGQSIRGKFADIDLTDYFKFLGGSSTNDTAIKTVVRNAQRMIKGKKLISYPITTNMLIGINNLLLPNKSFGIRRTHLWVGNKKTNTNAFEACEPHLIKHYLNDFLNFLNDNRTETLKRLAFGSFQFAMIHPFLDGNGRVWRCLFWSLLSKEIDEIQTLLIITYFKLINRKQLYGCCKSLRKDDHKSFIEYWTEAIDWSCKSFDIYNHIFGTNQENYESSINQLIEFDYYLKSEKRNFDLRQY